MPHHCHHHRRKLLPRSGASLTYIPAADGDGGSSGGQVYLFGGQDPVTGVIFDDLLVSCQMLWVESRAAQGWAGLLGGG